MLIDFDLDFSILGVALHLAAPTHGTPSLLSFRTRLAERKAKRVAAANRIIQAKQNAATVLGTFIEGPYKDWAETELRRHAETLAALRADFGDGSVRKGAPAH